MEGYVDIEGTEICQGDLVLWARPGMSTASDLIKGTVTKFTQSNMFIDKNKMTKGQSNFRVLVIRGEFKTYNKIEPKRQDGK